MDASRGVLRIWKMEGENSVARYCNICSGLVFAYRPRLIKTSKRAENARFEIRILKYSRRMALCGRVRSRLKRFVPVTQFAFDHSTHNIELFVQQHYVRFVSFFYFSYPLQAEALRLVPRCRFDQFFQRHACYLVYVAQTELVWQCASHQRT